MKQIIFSILFFFILFLPVSILAVEVAPRISDREIIEKLAGLEAGQDALRSEMKLGQDALRSEMKSGQDALRSEMKSGQDALRSEMNQRFKSIDQRFEALEKQYDRIWNLILVVLAGIMGLIGFIIWDRKTATQPLEKKITELEANLLRDLELRHEQGSLPTRLMYALRKLAENNPELSTILRSFSLL